MPSLLTKPEAAPAAAKVSAPILKNPFVRASLEHTEQFLDVAEGALSASAKQSGPHDVAPFGFMRDLVIKVTASGGAGASTLADDGPWNVLQNVVLMDVNGRPIFGPVDGYDLFLANLIGDYRYMTDPRLLPGYVAESTGNFTFYVRLPVEITPQNALGALPNLTSSATYKLGYTVAAASTVWSSQPATTLPSIQVEAWLEAWTQPLSTDSLGVPNEQLPPGVGTTQYWSKTQKAINAGEQRITLQRRGNLIRKLVMIYRDDSTPSVRTTTEFPADFRIEYEQAILHGTERSKFINDYYEYTGVTLPTGVFVWDFTHESEKAGFENRELYLPTTQSSRIEVVGTFSGTGGTLTLLTNDVAPAPKVAP